jgi:hypothetical protein
MAPWRPDFEGTGYGECPACGNVHALADNLLPEHKRPL